MGKRKQKDGSAADAAHDDAVDEAREPGEETTRVAKSREALDTLLDAIAKGRREKPDWIHLQGECRLDRLTQDELRATLARLHQSVLRGFKAKNVKLKNKKRRLEYWRTVAQAGFHDFSDLGWQKAYDSKHVENFDYVGDYLEGGLEALDAYKVYSSVLGTFDYTVEDFVDTELCRDVDTIAEPMAGTAEFSYHGHLRYPDFRFVMFDLDEDAKRGVEALPWNPDTEHHYVIANVLEEEVWQQVKSLTGGASLSYIGKQSHHLFDAKQLYRLIDVGTRYVDYFMLETPQVSLVTDMAGIEELTRPEMKDAGFDAGLVDEPGGSPNPMTNEMAFRLDVWDKTGERTLFRYPGWTNWSQPVLVAMGRMLDLNVAYYHSELEEFVSVDDYTDDCDCLDNVTFMIFTRHDLPEIEVDEDDDEEDED